MTQLHEMQHDEDEQSEQDQERMTRTGSFHQHNPWQEQQQQSTHGANPLGSGPQHPPGGPGGPEGSGAGGLNIGAMNPQQRPTLTPDQDRSRGQFRPGTQLGRGGLSPQISENASEAGRNPAGPTSQHNLGGPTTNSASAIITSLMRSEPQLTQTAIKIIQQLKTNIPQQLEPLRSATAIVSPDQRMEYNQLIEQVFHASQELDAKLPMFYVLLNNDEMLKQLVAINYSIQTQRSLLSSNQPRFVISLENLRSMAGELGRAKEIFQVALTNLVKSQQAAAANAQGGPR